MRIRRPWLPPVLSALVYLVATLVLGRELLRHLSSAIAHDAGDPLLNAAILHWTAAHLPYSDAWWQFPIYHPTADTLTFSEHLLGLSVIAAPLEWLTGDIPTAYNLTTLLTYPLCGMAMFALVFRLTKSASAAFLSGLAYAFAPMRASQLPHIQMLAGFWAPLSLLGLHAYLETGKRRWLALYGAAWMLQGAANGYALVFFSVLVGFWVLWFVVAQRRWRALLAIGAATLVAAIPLIPILHKYMQVHARNGLVRNLAEIRFFSADIAAVLCAPETVTAWGWIKVWCRPEGELFPGVALSALVIVGLIRYLLTRDTEAASTMSRAITGVQRVLAVVAVAYGLILAGILVVGPWRLELGPLRISAMSMRKPLLLMLVSGFAALALSPGIRHIVRRSATLGFYLVAAVGAWLLALGPTFTLMGESTATDGPFAWLMLLPGVDGLRVPARFWMISVLSLTTVLGLVLAPLLRSSRVKHAAWMTVLAVALLADGWIDVIPAQAIPLSPVPPSELRGRTVLQLPLGPQADIPATYFAARDGWRTINGYSGYSPAYYPILDYAVRFEESAAFIPFQAYGELDVVIRTDAPRLMALAERQPGARLVSRHPGFVHYALPQRGRPEDGRVRGRRIPITALESECRAPFLARILDDDDETRWVCGPVRAEQTLRVDLGAPVTVSAIVSGLGLSFQDFLADLTVETSMDGTSWQPARSGPVLSETITAAIEHPHSAKVVLSFQPRAARYIRLTHPARLDAYNWSIASLEIRGQ